MPIVIIGQGPANPGKKSKKEPVFINPVKAVKRTHKPGITVIDAAEEEKNLIKRQKARPFDIRINIKLAKFYREHNNWPEAEHHEEIVEYLDRIRRFVRNR